VLDLIAKPLRLGAKASLALDPTVSTALIWTTIWCVLDSTAPMLIGVVRTNSKRFAMFQT
jgi:hypothetical protein